MKILNTNLKFKQLTIRKETEYIILHHRAGNGDINSIHQEHLALGWAGCGYNFYIRKDGTVYQGRPINMVGSHCPNCNSKSVGICFEGDYSREKIMPLVQFEAGEQLIEYVRKTYKNTTIAGHRELYATACPGQYFPLAKYKAV